MSRTPRRTLGKIPNKCARLLPGAHVRPRRQARPREMAPTRFAGCNRSHFGGGAVLMSRPLMWKSAGLGARPIRSRHGRGAVRLHPLWQLTAAAAAICTRARARGSCGRTERRPARNETPPIKMISNQVNARRCLILLLHRFSVEQLDCVDTVMHAVK